MEQNKPTFKFFVKGINNFDEQCRIQSTILATLYDLGYNCNSQNFEMICEDKHDENAIMDLSCATYPCDGDTDARSYHKGFISGFKTALGE